MNSKWRGFYLFLAVVLVAVAISLGNTKWHSKKTEAMPATPIPETADVKLLKQLSLCVDADYATIDKKCLEKDFRPLLVLQPKDKVLFDGGFGVNTAGRYFTVHVQKTSRSGKIGSLFTLIFYVERHESNPKDSGNYCVFFRVAKGQSYGTPRKDIEGLISIDDITRGDALVSGTNGEVTSFLRLFDSGPCISNPRASSSRECGAYVWSPEHTASNLINGGKTIGDIIGDYLEMVEQRNWK